MNPILFDFGVIHSNLGFLQIRYYGLMYAIGVLLSIHLIKKGVKEAKIKLTEDEVFGMCLLTFFCGVIGGRAYYVLFNLDKYFNAYTPWYECLAIWHGGLAIHGAIIGAPLSGYFYCKWKKIGFLRITDICAPPVILAQAIGRIGNLMNGDAHGYPTDLPWGIVFKYGPAAHEFPGQALHPVMLYECFLNLVAFFLLYSLRNKGFKPGFISAWYLIAYSINRLAVTFLRADDLYIDILSFKMRAPQAISIFGILFAFGWILLFRLYQKADK